MIPASPSKSTIETKAKGVMFSAMLLHVLFFLPISKEVIPSSPLFWLMRDESGEMWVSNFSSGRRRHIGYSEHIPADQKLSLGMTPHQAHLGDCILGWRMQPGEAGVPASKEALPQAPSMHVKTEIKGKVLTKVASGRPCGTTSPGCEAKPATQRFMLKTSQIRRVGSINICCPEAREGMTQKHKMTVIKYWGSFLMISPPTLSGSH